MVLGVSVIILCYCCRNRMWVYYVFVQYFVVGIDFDQGNVVGLEIGQMLQYVFGVGFVELCVFDDMVVQDQLVVVGQIDVDYFDIGIDEVYIVLLCQFVLYLVEVVFVVDGVDLDVCVFFGIVVQMEYVEFVY